MKFVPDKRFEQLDNVTPSRNISYSDVTWVMCMRDSLTRVIVINICCYITYEYIVIKCVTKNDIDAGVIV
jgi:hypothetical protein